MLLIADEQLSQRRCRRFYDKPVFHSPLHKECLICHDNKRERAVEIILVQIICPVEWWQEAYAAWAVGVGGGGVATIDDTALPKMGARRSDDNRTVSK